MNQDLWAFRSSRLSWLTLLLATVGAARAGAQTPPELAVGEDLSHPVVGQVTISSSEKQMGRFVARLKVTSRTKRTISLAVFGAEGVGLSGGPGPWEVSPSKPQEFTLEGPAGAIAAAVVYSAEDTVPSEKDVFAPPAADAPPRERALRKHSLLPSLRKAALDQELSPVTADLAQRLFTTLDPVYFLYVSEPPKTGCALLKAEPVILLDERVGTMLRANGHRVGCGAIDDYFTTQRPAQLAFPAPEKPRFTVNTSDWPDEEFLSLADGDARIQKYRDAKAKAKDCFEKTWDKLDPDGRANRYDVVTYRGGKVQKIEGYADRLGRKVDATCKLTALFRERDAIRASLDKSFAQAEAKRLAEIKARFESP